MVADGTCPSGADSVLWSLERRGLVRVRWAEGLEAVDAELTPLGESYMENNPKLRNPLIGKRVGWIEIPLAATALTVAAIAVLILLALR